MDSLSLNLQKLSIMFVPFVMAVVFHEYAHGFIANRYGDNTAKSAGRLTLNPLPHVDPVGTVLFPLITMAMGVPFLFGWAKPVPINPSRFKKIRQGLFWVAVAGPGMNFILAILSAAIFCGLSAWMPEDFYLSKPLANMAIASVWLNYTLGIWNLIPIPPLDGSKVVEAFLPYEAAKKYEAIGQFGGLALLALMMTPAIVLLQYPIEFFSNLTLGIMIQLFHLQGVA